MNATDLERLVAAVRDDPAMELSCRRGDLGALVRWASERGYDLTLDEAAALAASRGELSDEVLENTAGGWDYSPDADAKCSKIR